MTEPASIVLYDGVCNFCNASVNFIINRDRREHFQFASLQSEIGQRLCAEHGITSDVSTLALVENGRGYVRSTAALRIAKKLDGLWPLFYVLAAVPRPLRDALYAWFAAHRYSWFGKSESCRIPSPEIRARFLS